MSVYRSDIFVAKCEALAVEQMKSTDAHDSLMNKTHSRPGRSSLQEPCRHNLGDRLANMSGWADHYLQLKWRFIVTPFAVFSLMWPIAWLYQAKCSSDDPFKHFHFAKREDVVHGHWPFWLNIIGFFGNFVALFIIVFTGLYKTWKFAHIAPLLFKKKIGLADEKESWQAILNEFLIADDNFRHYWGLTNAGAPWCTAIGLASVIMIATAYLMLAHNSNDRVPFAEGLCAFSFATIVFLSCWLAWLTSTCELIWKWAGQKEVKDEQATDIRYRVISMCHIKKMGVYFAGERWSFGLVSKIVFRIGIGAPTIYKFVQSIARTSNENKAEL